MGDTEIKDNQMKKKIAGIVGGVTIWERNTNMTQ